MPTWVYIVGALAGPLVAYLLGRRQAQKIPWETRKLKVETVDINVQVADRLRDSAVEDWQRTKGELDALRSEFRAYKSEMSERIDAQDSKIRLQDLRMKRLSEWAHRAFGVMTPEMRDEVGTPPLDDPLEEPPPVDGFSSMHPPPPGDTATLG
jgi:hypothetical protein